MHLQIGPVLLLIVLVAACKGHSPHSAVTYNNDEANPNCDSLDDRASELARKEAIELFSAESGVQSRQWEVSRGSRCDDRILVRLIVVDGDVRLPFFVQMDESFSHKVILRPE